MNPFELPDWHFFYFYLAAFVAAMIVAGSLRFVLRRPSAPLDGEALELGPYEIAYLHGGARLAVDAAIVRLARADAIAVEPGWGRLKLTSERSPEDATDLERAVHAAIGPDGTTSRAVRAAVAPHLAIIHQRLMELGLKMADDKAARFFPMALMLIVPALGVVKYCSGLSGDISEGFLVMVWIQSLLIAVFGYGVPIPRSRRGDLVLSLLREDKAGLVNSLDTLKGRDLALALGLFGTPILDQSSMADLHMAMKGLGATKPMRLESNADLWVPMLGIPAFGGVFLTVPLVGTPTEDSLLGTIGIVMVIMGFFMFAAVLMALPRFEELHRRGAWVPPGAVEYPVVAAMGLGLLTMWSVAGVMAAVFGILHLLGL